MAPSIISDIELPRNIPESRQSAANVPIQKAFGLDNRSVIITGAGRGLGITLAVAVLESGADAVCLDILPEPSAAEWEVITKLQKSTGVRATYHRCDITNEEAVEKVVADCGEEARQRGKPVKGMISCAGIQQMVDAIDYPMDGFRRIMEVNVTGSFLISKYTARLLRDQKLGGSIVMIASMSGQIANRVSSECFVLSAFSYLQILRVCIAQHTTLAKLLYTRCAALSPTSGVNGASESTPYLLVAFVSFQVEHDVDHLQRWSCGRDFLSSYHAGMIGL